MPIEVEQKFRVADRQALLSTIARLQPIGQSPVNQVDTYYAHPARDFAATDEALRLRSVGGKNLITYKGPKLDATTKTRHEIELPLAEGSLSASQWDELLTALSFRRVAEVSKVRQAFRLVRDQQTIEIAVDQVNDLGEFVELEIVVATRDEVETAQRLLTKLATDLELVGVEPRSYLELLLEK